MNISSMQNLSLQSFFTLKDKTLSVLSPLQKKVLAVALVVFSALALLYLVISTRNNQRKMTPDNKDQAQEVKDPALAEKPQAAEMTLAQKKQQSKKAFLSAIDLMFDTGTLQDRLSLRSAHPLPIPQSTYPFHPEQQKAIHKRLKEELAKILPDHINFTTNYREWMTQGILTKIIYHFFQENLA